jgi:hypothetical protein
LFRLFAQLTRSILASGSLKVPKLSWATAKKVYVPEARPAVEKVKLQLPLLGLP